MRITMFVLGALMVTCTALGWCCVRVGCTWDEDDIDF